MNAFVTFIGNAALFYIAVVVSGALFVSALNGSGRYNIGGSQNSPSNRRGWNIVLIVLILFWAAMLYFGFGGDSTPEAVEAPTTMSITING